MKALLTIFALIFVVSMANASDPSLAVKAQVKNLDDVIKSIHYPEATRESATEGRVIVVMEINELGAVTKSNVVAYPCSQLKAEVERAVEGLQFEPAKNSNGESIASSVRLPIEFQLTVD